MKKETKVKRLKRSITEAEYKKLILSVTRNKTIREHTRQNYLRTFTILFYTGLRLNEVQEIRVKNIKELLELGTSVLYISKTNSERELFSSDDFNKDIKKLFDFHIELNEMKVITKGSDKNRMTGLDNKEFTRQINKIMNEVLGAGYTSHSFRQGLLTEMASKGVNISLMAQFIGHSNISTTNKYVKSTKEDIKKNLVR